MSKKGKLYIALIVLAIVSIVILESNKPKDINWFPSYATHHKIPFGSYVFNEQVKRISDAVIEVDRPPFEYLSQNDINGTYVFFNSDITFRKPELNALLDWTSRGNTLFVAALNFEKLILDTLSLNTSAISKLDNFNNDYRVQLVNPKLNTGKSYLYDKANFLYHFDDIDTLKTKIVGIIGDNSASTIKDSLVNVIRQPFGNGQIILSTFPQAFTNYFILDTPNQEYTSGLLSYINPDSPIYIDKYYKSGKTFYTSPMYLFLNTQSLKWAYYMVLIGAVFYIIFEGKRKQRAIPIISPLKNQTIDFTRTIANMYYEKGRHKDLALHKVQHFLEYIRTHLHLNTSEIDAEFIKHLAARSNNSIKDTQELFDIISGLTHKTSISNTELEQLNNRIETFKSQNRWKTKP